MSNKKKNESTKKRVPISKALRFEVFKRDNFTCQYCGRSAPEVVLEVDHIVPVSKGGTNDLFNLVTSCKECNRGKSNKELSDDTTIKKQKAELDKLNEKREQLEMMVRWKEELQKLIDQQVDYVNDYITSISNWSVTDYGKKKLGALIRKFGFPEVCAATEIAFDYYYHGNSPTWIQAFNKIGGICYNRKKQREVDGNKESS